jgi:hypothetical protein
MSACANGGNAGKFNPFVRFSALGPRDLKVVTGALLLLLAVQPSIRLMGFKFAVYLAGWLAGRKAKLSPLTLSDLEIERIAFVVRGCCRRWPFRATCLDRAFVGFVLLRRHGVPVSLWVGFNKSQQGVEGHAWVEHCSRVLAESMDVKNRFSRQVLMA